VVCLLEEFDSLKTQIRATPALSIGEINTRVLNEDAISTKVVGLLASKPYVLVTTKIVEPIKYARITVVIQKDTYLKNVGSSLHSAPRQNLTHGVSNV